ncbi:Gfo/Idh/MocA family protein [Zymomonas mobilis]|uniref:Oxidoreductase domain protein n=1 Tax=Zymomonas mobilis subsp. mobilis (strain ATCC 31821 / ZM4 / CP4) TaxID=264203 RepID=A0A806CP47_ZYMMO|nr:Gfo/Idh/MocA family oxidoreductase [Zymomonas mobilis]ADC33833.1 oxidoreductase domain protein [Zymomonas mobilis subsp. mobilis ZM4 = ATCC 31821]AHB11088.1 putative dehydrogenase [Zymomonas mobilis subsp. mobilis str. CP4 = NRRL B-14023]AHJ71362.1 Inositol 2-dehydrogenase/D-chiro-inositol 3-dehydrogenase [Zymomonas mobilis subsp. mobilis NRRL B-12526]AHJ73208.1 Inositol 2-dehydrogenase/D-chiro-inositol 3-dehydrogenase [Zymomonas mobilis subsp. mobilis str. CP4 = NRRL B-14023]
MTKYKSQGDKTRQSSKKTIRFGLIGTGMMAQEHIRNLKLIPNVEITSIMDPVDTSLDWAKQSLGDQSQKVTVHHNLDTMIDQASSDLDAVIIASPNHTHHDILLPLLKTDLHILCEKPLCTTILDAKDIVERVKNRKAVFWVGMEYRYMLPVAEFIDDIRKKKIGRLTRLSIIEHRFPFLKKVGDWNRFNRNSGGTMVEKCCHFFDLMRYITQSEPVRVFCSGGVDVNHLDERYNGEIPDIIDNSYSVVDFDNGIRVMLDLCMFAEGSEEQEELIAIGDKAKLSVTIPSGVKTLSHRVPVDAPKRIERQHVSVDADVLAAGSHHGATYYQLDSFIKAIRKEGTTEVTAEDGLKAIAMGVAAEISAREKRVVTIKEVFA